MCGIVGFLSHRTDVSAEAMGALAQQMADTLAHRGPDGDGVWVDPAAGIALGHRRLAIIDLSAGGRQPMMSASGRYVISYNGEVYNFLDLRAELEAAGHRFRAGTDTEVMLTACDAWGPTRALSRFWGMFAFALWDRQERRLMLARDRLGKKPLYWGRIGGTWLFASQPKALMLHPAWRGILDRDALAALLKFNYIPAPRSIWSGIAKLRPGHFATIDASGEAVEACYWDLRALARDGLAARGTVDAVAAEEQLEHLLKDAVRRRLIGDVPLGAFLSGGIDSSTVVALMQAASTRPVRTYTIGFRQPDYDESAHARGVAAHLGTDHTELYAEPGDALDLATHIPDYFDEPFADASQIPTLLLSRLTRQHVTVALSGDGGDEMFAGYSRYVWAQELRRWLQPLPARARGLMARGILALPPHAWDALFRLVPARHRPRLAGDRLHKLAGVIRFSDADDLYWRLVSLWPQPTALVAGAAIHQDQGGGDSLRRDIPDFIDRMQYFDQTTYLPDDILTKVDRASMSVGLEVRAPLIDHRVVEFAWGLPRALKLRHGSGKWILRRILHRFVPKHLVERPKMGFAVPIADWLRGPLRDWAEDMLSPRSLTEDGLFEAAPIRTRFAEHLSGRRNWQYSLWGVLMVQAWRRRWMSGPDT